MQDSMSADNGKPDGVLRGSSIIAEIKASRIEFVVSLPDITTSEGLLRPLSQSTIPRLIRVCKEDEGVGICAGLSYTERRSLLLIQQTGLLDSINAVRGVAVEYALPICMMVGLLQKKNPASRRRNRDAMACGSSSLFLMPWGSRITRSKRRPTWERSNRPSTMPMHKAGLWCC
jgi:hypothetical protein